MAADEILEPYREYARKFGSEEVLMKMASGALAHWLRPLRDQLPGPVDLTWMSQAKRDRILDGREGAFTAYRREFKARRAGGVPACPEGTRGN